MHLGQAKDRDSEEGDNEDYEEYDPAELEQKLKSLMNLGRAEDGDSEEGDDDEEYEAGELEDEEDEIDDDGQQYLEKLEKSVSFTNRNISFNSSSLLEPQQQQLMAVKHFIFMHS